MANTVISTIYEDKAARMKDFNESMESLKL